MLLDDLEKATTRATAAEREAEMLRERLSKAREEALEEERRAREESEGREGGGGKKGEDSAVDALNRELGAKVLNLNVLIFHAFLCVLVPPPDFRRGRWSTF